MSHPANSGKEGWLLKVLVVRQNLLDPALLLCNDCTGAEPVVKSESCYA